jgi:uncharacterized cupin superfamily protein
MTDVTVKRIDEMEAIFGGAMRRARASLGVTSFGMQILDMPAGWHGYPNHNHAGDPVDDRQEEVYTALTGAATLEAGGRQWTLEPGVFARVGAGEKRKIVPGPDGARLLCLGAMPGAAYTAPEFTELGGPEPGLPQG